MLRCRSAPSAAARSVRLAPRSLRPQKKDPEPLRRVRPRSLYRESCRSRNGFHARAIVLVRVFGTDRLTCIEGDPLSAHLDHLCGDTLEMHLDAARLPVEVG